VGDPIISRRGDLLSMPDADRGISLKDGRASTIGAVMLFFFSLSLLIVPTLAHAPLATGNNEDLASATFIPDPTKSWALYAELHQGGEAQYYRFDILKGERIHASMFTTAASEDVTFVPELVLMGAGVLETDTIPSYIETPSDAGVISVRGTRASRATYEGFAPSVFVELADINMEAPETGTYYLAVYDSDRGGHYGLAVGDQESFTLAEWILSPYALLSVYQWERQNMAIVLVPAIAIFLIGLYLIFRRQPGMPSLDVPGWIASMAGLLYLGTGAIVYSQMFFALSYSMPDSFVIVTILFGTIPIILGLEIIRSAFRHTRQWNVHSRTWLIILAVLGITAWAGYVIGPILVGIASILPAGMRKKVNI
jgi:hypothetical protein